MSGNVFPSLDEGKKCPTAYSGSLKAVLREVIMSKIAVVYWSGTGNTEMMASKVLEGARANGAEAVLYTASQFRGSLMDQYDAVAFGCRLWVRRNWKSRSSLRCLRNVSRS